MWLIECSTYPCPSSLWSTSCHGSVDRSLLSNNKLWRREFSLLWRSMRIIYSNYSDINVVSLAEISPRDAHSSSILFDVREMPLSAEDSLQLFCSLKQTEKDKNKYLLQSFFIQCLHVWKTNKLFIKVRTHWASNIEHNKCQTANFASKDIWYGESFLQSIIIPLEFCDFIFS